MCEVRSKEKRTRTQKKKYNGQQQKKMDCHEPHLAPNEKTQPIQWTKQRTGALVVVNSLWPPGRAHPGLGWPERRAPSQSPVDLNAELHHGLPPSRAELIPGLVGLNAEPRHRRSLVSLNVHLGPSFHHPGPTSSRHRAQLMAPSQTNLVKL